MEGAHTMSADFRVLYKALPALIACFPGAVDAVLSAGMQRVVDYAVANHPWQNETGETEASIHMEQGPGAHEFTAVFGGASIFLEWGTVNMSPYPTIQPAWDAVEPSIEDGLSPLAEKIP